MFYEAEQVSLFDLDIWCGKTSPEHSAAASPKAQTSRQSSKKSSKSQSRMPMCVSCRRTADGQNPAVITIVMEDGPLLGEYTMHSFGESPREENASRLSQILEASPHPKYSLSAKACQGILNRAERRGKVLPEALERALIAQSASKSEQDAQGGGKGILIQNERTGALSTLNNQSVFCLQGNGIDRADTAGCNGKGWREDVSYTLNTIDRPAVALHRLFQPMSVREENWAEGEVKNAIRAGESKVSHAVVCCDVGFFNSYTEQATTLLSRQYKDPPITNQNIVRRLTPLECERLQGYPDGWTDIGEWVDSKGKRHKEADSPRYKALGNSIALPFWKWLLKRISAQYERDATLGSLFDGIGGFPLCWEQINGKGSARWASEIEEFLMAVTKLRFKEE